MIEDEYTYNGKGATGQHAVVEHYQITTAKYGTIDAALLSELNRREAEKAKTLPLQAKEEKPRQGNCPFTDRADTKCIGIKCALYSNGCTLAQIGQGEYDTAGRTCPFNKYHMQCQTDCAMYKNGCALTALAHKLSESEDK